MFYTMMTLKKLMVNCAPRRPQDHTLLLSKTVPNLGITILLLACVNVTSKNSFGIIHLDFKKTNNNPVVAVLPDDCPTPMDLIEDQLHDGNTVYIDAGSRVVRCYGVTNVRYVVNLVGYFNDN